MVIIIISMGLLCVIAMFVLIITTVVILINAPSYALNHHWCVFSFIEYGMLTSLSFAILFFPMLLLSQYHFH